jgi:hypothetical protein
MSTQTVSENMTRVNAVELEMNKLCRCKWVLLQARCVTKVEGKYFKTKYGPVSI